ncbi:hypothetical protein B005_1359 [Nocardiopsis alba ATCC BAA-2165]|uniref:Uncharacterized protein n=1 Tax=Nocardiopsis alba (strain ATCC BAA-2165 / BE74) TaxID=1205910 RepID=J7L736_NOCAA|nr:hypothetical protein B005_1359 [Nocardiopsis alba ATCC BAA-2165]
MGLPSGVRFVRFFGGVGDGLPADPRSDTGRSGPDPARVNPE